MVIAQDHSDEVRPKGHLTIESRPADSDDPSDWETRVDKDNLIVDVGLDKLRDILQGDSEADVTQYAYGTDTTTEAAGDTSLGNEVYRSNFAGSTDPSTGAARWTALMTSIEPSGQPYDISEFGVFFEDGVMLARTTFPAETKDSTQEWRIRYTLTFASA